MMRSRPLVTALAAFLSVLPFTAVAANLSAIYQLARDNDARLAAARAERDASQEKPPQGRAGLLPTLSLTASAGNNDNNYKSAFSASEISYTPHGYSLNLRQPLYNRPSLEFYEQTKLLGHLGDQQLRLAEQDLMLRVATAYFDVLLAQDALATTQAQKQAYAEQLAQARKSFEVGAATITDTHEAQARYDLTQAQEIAAQNDLEVKTRGLEKIIDQEAPKLARLNEQARMPLPDPLNMDAWLKQAEADSLPVNLKQTALEVARREVQVRRGGHHPTLDLKASYTDLRNGSTDNTTSKTGALALELGWNLYKGGGIEAAVREAVASQEKTRHELDEARRQSRLDARQGYLGVISGDAQARALEQALVSSEAQLKSSKLGLDVGVRTRVDVLNAQQQLYTTKRDLAAARYRTLLAGLQLKAAAGTLRPDDLNALDSLLQEQP